MAIRPNDEERPSFGADRERQREVSDESARSARPSSGDDSSESANGSQRGRSNRGFASMDRSKQREIASKGGRAAHEKGTAHEFDSGEARAAGRKGGVTVSRNREHMAAIGRRGGEARGANRAARVQQEANSLAAQNPVANADTRVAADREVSLGGPSVAPGSSQRSSGNSLGGENRTSSAPERSIER